MILLWLRERYPILNGRIAYINFVVDGQERKKTLHPDGRDKYLSATRLVGSWCLMPLSTLYQLYHGSQFY